MRLPHHLSYAAGVQKWLTLGCALLVCALPSGANADNDNQRSERSVATKQQRVRVEIAVWGKLLS